MCMSSCCCNCYTDKPEIQWPVIVKMNLVSDGKNHVHLPRDILQWLILYTAYSVINFYITQKTEISWQAKRLSVFQGRVVVFKKWFVSQVAPICHGYSHCCRSWYPMQNSQPLGRVRRHWNKSPQILNSTFKIKMQLSLSCHWYRSSLSAICYKDRHITCVAGIAQSV
jgi:hypothetical protein